MRTLFLKRFAGAAACAALAVMTLAGCGHDETPPANTTVVNPTPAPMAPSTTTTTVVPGASSTTTMAGPDTKVNTNAGPGTSNGTDTALSDAVNTAIVHNKQMTGSRVEVLATAGVVTLNGQVQNQQQKALAETTASKTPGVSSVKNKLIIVTTGGAKPKPVIVTKIKTVTKVVHDQAAPPSGGGADSAPADSGQPPASPASPADPAAPATPNGATTP